MRKGGEGVAARRSRLLAAVALAVFALLAAGCVPPVVAGPGDYDVSVSPSVNPVNAPPGATVRFRTLLRNHGPLTAGRVAFVDTIPMFTTFQSVTTTQGGCAAPGSDRRIVCLIGSLDQGDAVTVDVVVLAPTAIGARLVNTATSVTSPVDTHVNNNTRTAVSTVQPPDPNSATGAVGPGSTLTTRVSAIDTDRTVSSITLPLSANGQTLTLRERNGDDFCAVAGAFCTGQTVRLSGLHGTFVAADPPLLAITYDASLGLVPANLGVWMQNGTSATAGTRLPSCNGAAVTCVRSMHVFSASDAPSPDDVGDLRVVLAVFSAGTFGVR